jgi:dihydroxy-acid dehydratase
MELRSDAMKKGLARAPHRSLLKADGLTDEELERPLVAVFSSQNEIIPGHIHLPQKMLRPLRRASAWPAAPRSR